MQPQLRILLIEDNHDDVYLFKDMLKRTSFANVTLLVAGSIKELVNSNLAQKEFTLIFLDFNLPDGRGTELVGRVNEYFPNVPIIILTGFDDLAIALEALRKGAQNYLVKSRVSYDELERSIYFALERNEINLKLKNNEKRFRSLIEHLYDGIALSDAHGNLFPSPKTDNMLGYTFEDIVASGKTNLFMYVHPDDKHILEASYNKALSMRGKAVYSSVRLLHSSGHYIWVEGMITNMLHDPAVKAVVSNLRDISDRKKAEEQIQQINEELEARVAERTMQLEAATKDMEAFSYSVSHDLRSPLQSIKSITKLVEEDYVEELSEDMKEYISMIARCADKVMWISDGLLSFFRLGEKELHKTEINMHELVENVFKEVADSYDDRYTINIGAIPPAMGDFELIYEVWMNFVTNAIKYTSKKDNPAIEIGFDQQTSAYYVKDNGAGFDMKNVDKLFKPFQRMHTQDQFKGTGVGLSLVHRILTKHSGKIWVDSKLNEGTTFFFTLPAHNSITHVDQ